MKDGISSEETIEKETESSQSRRRITASVLSDQERNEPNEGNEFDSLLADIFDSGAIIFSFLGVLVLLVGLIFTGTGISISGLPIYEFTGRLGTVFLGIATLHMAVNDTID